MKQILLISGGFFHPPLRGQWILHKVLRQLDGLSFTHIHSLEKAPPDLERFSALVLHFHQKTISAPVLARLDDFVKNGGGILAMHAATASFKETPAYFDILGGRFSGHAQVASFEVIPHNSEIFKGFPSFRVKDELYFHELNDRIQVHFMAKHEGKEVPLVWTYAYGKGRVCYASPGHTSATMGNPAYQALLRRGLEWVTK